MVECLVGDFNGNMDLADIVATSRLDVFSHNMETVERLTPLVRDRKATYKQSLRLLKHINQKHPTIKTKSSLMVGCGETSEEVVQTMKDLRDVGVHFLTIGQYVRPTKGHLPVDNYISPQQFLEFETIGKELGFAYVASGPLIRSSYKAGEFFIKEYLQRRELSNNSGN